VLGTNTSTAPTDPVAPRLVRAALESPTQVRATFSEAVTLAGADDSGLLEGDAFDARDWSLPDTAFTAALADGHDVVLTAERSARATSVAPGEGLAYSGDSVTDATGNTAATSLAPLRDAAAPRVASALAASSDTIVITLTEPSTGAVDLNAWSVALEAADTADPADTASSTLAPTSVSAPGATLASGTLELATPATAITLTLGVNLADDATPAVTYTVPVPAQDAAAVTIADALGNSLAPATALSVEAHDGIRPRLESAAFVGNTAIDVGFSEGVAVPAGARWSVVGVTSIAVTAAATLPADASTVRLTVEPAEDSGQ